MNPELALLNFIDGIATTDFSIIIEVIKYAFIGFWLIVVGWVWVDSGERTTHLTSRILGVIVVGVLNLLGLVIYLLVRPKQTIQELYWADLERRYLKYETSELGDCQNCKHSLQPGFNVCPNCGFQIKKQCGRCNVWVEKSYAYCPFCASGFANVVAAKEEVVEVVQTPDVMQVELNKSKEEAIKVVEGNQTKYVDRHGALHKVKGDFKDFIIRLGDSILRKKSKNKSVLAKIEPKKVNKKDKKKKRRK
jgi:RNA polymerase subunit RPABC4/transcription elongation factor Spt4